MKARQIGLLIFEASRCISSRNTLYAEPTTGHTRTQDCLSRYLSRWSDYSRFPEGQKQSCTRRSYDHVGHVDLLAGQEGASGNAEDDARSEDD